MQTKFGSSSIFEDIANKLILCIVSNNKLGQEINYDNYADFLNYNFMINKHSNEAVKSNDMHVKKHLNWSQKFRRKEIKVFT